MIKVAVTGGIGSGKSTICMVFQKLGIPVFNADLVAKDILSNNLTVKNHLIKLFGSDIYQRNGALHRKKLADIIFNDKIALQKVNEIVHPVVYSRFIDWAKNQTSPYVIQESAIVFENDYINRFDKIITVTAPLELKIERCMARDGITRELVLERIKNQLPDENLMERSDFVIVNNDNEMVLPQIINIHNKLV